MQQGRTGKRLRGLLRSSERVYRAPFSSFFTIQNTRLESMAYRIPFLPYFVSGRVPIIIKHGVPLPRWGQLVRMTTF